MKRTRNSEQDEIRQDSGAWSRPWGAYPAAVAFFFGVNGGGAHTANHDFRPQDRDLW